MKDSVTDVPFWVWGCLGLWLVSCVWRGWRVGMVRQVADLVALAVAITAGYWAGPYVGMVIPAIGFPAFLSPLVGGILIGGLIGLLITLCSAIVFRKTSDQGFGMIRIVYGGVGACLGLASGLTLLGLGAWAVRWAGSLSEGVHASLAHRKTGTATASASAKTPEPEDLLLTLKKALDESTAGSVLKSVDPVSPQTYRLLAKVGQVSAKPEALERFLAQQPLQPLVNNPNVRALRDDAALRDAILERDLVAVLSNPRVHAVARDSQVLHVLRSFDLEKALNEALAIQGSSPSPAPKTAPASEKKRAAPR
jgi:hypothetical protein